MLGLLKPTDPAWVAAAESNLPLLLQDHAHCELKAAQNALSLLARFGGEVPALVEPLATLAREETSHFVEVERELRGRGARLAPPRADDYVVALRTGAKRDRPEGQPALLDRLLVPALIEGRSCERFHLLSERLRDSALRRFYRELMAAEAQHFTLFCTLAAECCGKDDSRRRFATLVEIEAQVADRLPLAPTVHG
jgi:tRNA 2-(methylsulfanyl)-N6-isopentenyladenosine37 hydroxylase